MIKAYRQILVAALLAGSALVVPRTASAGFPIIEHYDEARPEEAAAIMQVLREELLPGGRWGDPVAVGSLMPSAPRPAIKDPRLTSAMLTDELELAVKTFIRVRYEAAVGELQVALKHAADNPGLVVNNEKTRHAVSRAQVALALTYLNLDISSAETRKRAVVTMVTSSGNRKKPAEAANNGPDYRAKAVRAMADYIRSTRESVVPKMFGPPGEEFYHEVRKIVDPQQRGNLVINVSEPDAQLFVNGVSSGRGDTFAGLLIPGDYCVVAQVGRTAIRYDVPVFAGDSMTLEINWASESAIHVSAEWVGIMTPRGAKQATYVPRVARLGNVRALTVLGVRREEGYLAVTGTYYDVAPAPRIAWSGEVHLEMMEDPHVVSAANKAKLHALAQFISRSEPAPGVYPIGTAEPDPGSAGPPRWPSYVAGTAALGGFALGGYLLHIDGQPRCDSEPAAECKHLYSSRTQGFIAIGGGVLAATFAVTWWYLHPRAATPMPAAMVSISPSGAMLTVSGRF